MSDLSSAIRRASREELAAHRLAAGLDGRPWADRLNAVRGDASFHGTAFVELAMALARDQHSPLAEAEDWARLGVEAARHSLELRAAELEALAWAVLGNVRRRRGDLRGARVAFARCAARRGRVADPIDLAETYSLEASFLSQVRELGNAWDAVCAAHRLAQPFGQVALLARYEIKAGMIANEDGRYVEAAEILSQGLERLDVAREPGLVLIGGHNLAGALVGMGFPEPAARGLCRLRPLYERHGSAKLALQRDWIWGRIAIARGCSGEARARLEAVRDGFLRMEMPCDAAMVMVESVIAGLGGGQEAEAAAAASRILATAGARRESEAAVELLRGAIARRAELGVIERLARHAQRMIDVGRYPSGSADGP